MLNAKIVYLGATDGDVDSNLFVTSDTKSTDGITSLACGKNPLGDARFNFKISWLRGDFYIL